jgi:hypothetical protein
MTGLVIAVLILLIGCFHMNLDIKEYKFDSAER